VEPILRFSTWLAPGLPLGIFGTIADHVGRKLDRRVELSSEPKISGPMHPDDDLFTANGTDVGFLCPPPYLWLSERPEPTIRLVPMAPVFDDSRNRGRPVYFSDIVVAHDSPVTMVDHLGGRGFGFNDRASLSGYHSVLAWLSGRGLDLSFFGSFEETGGHRRSLDRIVAGDLDAAAVDTNVWRAWERENPDRVCSVRSLTAIGPHPVQPIVVRSALAHLVEPLTDALADPELAQALAPFGIVGFAPISHDDYRQLATTLVSNQSVGSQRSSSALAVQ
jgi:phosphonate transport system substrate-binding protein